MRKPIFPKLIFLKKARRLKKFKLLKHYQSGTEGGGLAGAMAPHNFLKKKLLGEKKKILKN
jgi:hypothetical protein